MCQQMLIRSYERWAWIKTLTTPLYEVWWDLAVQAHISHHVNPSLCKGLNQTHKTQGLSVKSPTRHGNQNSAACMKKDSVILKHVRTKTVKEMYCRGVLLPFQMISVECILWALATFLHYWWIKLSLFKGSCLVTHEFLQKLLKKPLMWYWECYYIYIAIDLQKNEPLLRLISYRTGEP